MKKPKISVILCTYNSEKLLPKCLNSILSQTYKDFEVLCIEKGSKDNTMELIKDYQEKDKRVRLIFSNGVLPEGHGNKKWEGFRKARGEIVGIIDHDNILQDGNLFRKVVNSFNVSKKMVGILGGLKHDCLDKPIVRFVSIFGGDPFFSYRSVDYLRNLKDYSVDDETEMMNLSLDNMGLTGGNCFFYRKKDVEKIKGYDQDILVVQRLIKSGNNKLVIIKEATKHYAEKNLFMLLKKIALGKRAYYQKKNNQRFNYLPKTVKERNELIKTIIFNLLILPNFLISAELFKLKKDSVVFFYPLIVFIDTINHLINFFRKN